MITRIRASLRDDRGDSTILMIGMVLVLLIAIGLVVDGGGKLQADNQARYAAEQAARAAGQQIEASQVNAGERPSVNLSAAAGAASSVLTASGVQGTVSADGDRIVVTTRTTYQTKMLSLIGIGQFTSTATAEARIARGITQEAP